MATSLAHDAKNEDWIGPGARPRGESFLARAEWLIWALFSLALFAAFLVLVVDDYPLRNLIAAQ